LFVKPLAGDDPEEMKWITLAELELMIQSDQLYERTFFNGKDVIE